MEPENQDAPEVLETPEEETVEETIEETEEGETPEGQQDEEKAALKKENEELKKKNAQLFERAKKNTTSSVDKLSALDAVALVNAGITNEEDIQEAIEFAEFKKIPVREAIKNKTLKGLLDNNVSERKTAAATQTGGGRRNAGASSGDTLLARANNGELPQGDEDIAKLARARIEKK